ASHTSPAAAPDNKTNNLIWSTTGSSCMCVCVCALRTPLDQSISELCVLCVYSVCVCVCVCVYPGAESGDPYILLCWALLRVWPCSHVWWERLVLPAGADGWSRHTEQHSQLRERKSS